MRLKLKSTSTLWELDRFVTNYRRIEIANQARVAAAKTVFATVTMCRDSKSMPPRTRQRHGNMDAAHTVSADDRPHKRDMTDEEKKKLSTNLQSLPLGKKLDAVVQIVNRRKNDEVEVEVDIDIDSVDSDTLWELDRFVIDYKINAELTSRVAAAMNPAQPATEDPPALARVKISDYADRSSISSSSSSSHPGSSSTDVGQDGLMFDGKEER